MTHAEIQELFKKELGLDSILFGFGLDSDALHSPNEHYGLFNYYKGIETIPLFYKHFMELSKWEIRNEMCLISNTYKQIAFSR